MEYPLEKILTASAGDYVDSRGKKLSEYEMMGVHYEQLRGDVSQIAWAGVIPEDAEVVTDLRVVYNPGFEVYIDGTALIPKKE